METQVANRMFRAFADERRLRILHLLRDSEMCVGDLVEILQLPQSTVSRHLAELREAELVVPRQDGLWRHYRLADPCNDLHTHLVQCLNTCFADVPVLQRDAARAQKVKESGGCCPS